MGSGSQQHASCSGCAEWVEQLQTLALSGIRATEGHFGIEALVL